MTKAEAGRLGGQKGSREDKVKAGSLGGKAGDGQSKAARMREGRAKKIQALERERDEARDAAREALYYCPRWIQAALRERYRWMVEGPSRD